MSASFEELERTLAEIKDGGLYKEERVIAGPQGAEITLVDGRRVLNFCANVQRAHRRPSQAIGSWRRAARD